MSSQNAAQEDVAVFVMVFLMADHSLGFDLSPLGLKLFRLIIGDAKTWDTKSNSLVNLEKNEPFQFIKKYVGWLSQPITVASDLARYQSRLELDVLSRLPKLMNGDPDDKNFADMLIDVFAVVDRLCIHSVGQWHTITLTRRASKLLSELEVTCKKAGIGYRVVQDEANLPRW